MDLLLKSIKYVRAVVVRSLKRQETYFSRLSIRPLSTKYGFDRGLPVDRYFIEGFLREHQDDVRGHTLEIVDTTYSKKFGGGKTTTNDALDIFLTQKANIHGDLRNLNGVIPDNTYDCIIVTQTLNVVDDYQEAISECHRILKKGGVLLVTLPTLSPTWNLKINMWRFTATSAKEVFSRFFLGGQVTASGLGNRQSAIGFWVGMAVEDMKYSELAERDAALPLIIGVRAVK
jgi:SAM-dependent methyltransferase